MSAGGAGGGGEHRYAPTCAICISDIEPQDEAFLDSCFHTFCYQVGLRGLGMRLWCSELSPAQCAHHILTCIPS